MLQTPGKGAIARIALTAAFGFAALSTVPGQSRAADSENEIVVIGQKAEEFDWTSTSGLDAYDWGDIFGIPSFDGSGGGGDGGFILELPPDCEVEICWDTVPVDSDDAFDDELVKIIEAANSLTEEQLAAVKPYVVMAASEVDFQLYFASLGGVPDLSLYESLMTTALDLTKQFGYENGAITP